MGDFDEGLGTVYERLVMNDIFDRLMETFSIKNVLEVPVYGMTGLTGINSVEFTNKGCSLTTVDNSLERIEESKELWGLIRPNERIKFCYADGFSELPFKDNSFDLVWNFAALWHIEDAPSLIEEMVRVSSNLVFISVQNNRQIGYYLRKYLIDRKLFTEVHETWLNLSLIRDLLAKNGTKIVEQGVFDIPPFPDIAMPISELFTKVGLRRGARRMGKGDTQRKRWKWNIVDYYTGKDPQLNKRLRKFMFIENSPLPSRLKALWAHHRYILAQKGIR